MAHSIKNNLVIFALLIVCIPLIIADINIITPSGKIYTGSLITISWQIYGQPPTNPGLLKIESRSTGQSTLIDDNLNLQALSKIWNVSVPEDNYFLSINYDSSENISGDFTILQNTSTASGINFTVIIIVIIVGCIVIFIPIFGGILFLKKWRKKESEEIPGIDNININNKSIPSTHIYNEKYSVVVFT
ncbi:9620_t:CDS:2 [Scutellospora calospora]|uniref:9620_t:CDS:1 n=1 Tax=Scutellospora calospora TaxID=85575 RepID=A0ACA9LQI9_9GLOM|nr:9620_t:CDS:2 [Scutellospora calospora]